VYGWQLPAPKLQTRAAPSDCKIEPGPMSHRGYPSTSAAARIKLEALTGLPDDAPEWPAFLRDEMRLALWMLPAAQAAVRQGAWRAASDPVAHIRASVHRLAIAMRLRNHAKPLAEPEDE